MLYCRHLHTSGTNCRHLEYLTLDFTAVSDEGLLALTDCASLKTLRMRRTQITPDGKAAFHTARPDVKLVE